MGLEADIVGIINGAFEQINKTRVEKIDTTNVMEIGIYGERGVFDSMGAVNFVSMVEESIYDNLDLEVSLLSEKALSLKISPFSSVRRLVSFILSEIEAAEVA